MTLIGPVYDVNPPFHFVEKVKHTYRVLRKQDFFFWKKFSVKQKNMNNSISIVQHSSR